MCDDCGCEHDHDHDHGQHDDIQVREIKVNTPIFAANDRVAERNRGFFAAHDLFVTNVVSSPGSGKTTLLAKTIEHFKTDIRTGVIAGDLETDLDASRIRKTGAQVFQITTGQLCHLDAEMVARAMKSMDLKTLDMLMIENVGNLVCPAGFDLGENVRIVLLSITEGEDKPLKYPPMFRFADVVVITKTDLAPYVDCDRGKMIENVFTVNPAATIFELSAKTGDGMKDWYNFLIKESQSHKLSLRAKQSNTESH